MMKIIKVAGSDKESYEILSSNLVEFVDFLFDLGDVSAEFSVVALDFVNQLLEFLGTVELDSVA